jgi:hypothetical protein
MRATVIGLIVICATSAWAQTRQPAPLPPPVQTPAPPTTGIPPATPPTPPAVNTTRDLLTPSPAAGAGVSATDTKPQTMRSQHPAISGVTGHPLRYGRHYSRRYMHRHYRHAQRYGRRSTADRRRYVHQHRHWHKVFLHAPYSGPAFALWQKRYEEPQWNPYEPYGYGTAFAPD